MTSYRFELLTEVGGEIRSSETWGRFQASNVSEAVGAFKYAFQMRAEEIEKGIWRITKPDGTGWIRRIK